MCQLVLRKYSEYLTDGCWSPTRPSVLFVAKTDGTFDVWDLMFRQKSAEYSVKVTIATYAIHPSLLAIFNFPLT